jgi:hypothetical protein
VKGKPTGRADIADGRVTANLRIDTFYECGHFEFSYIDVGIWVEVGLWLLSSQLEGLDFDENGGLPGSDLPCMVRDQVT